ncbi:protein ALP1-like [Sitophilus oryzae]|uniref:Protein ALP1-like n=1 Tax=Sitophilus oryzae TaxID=7048 RepID=A0A6J2YYX1_SITOR|nr:protein ALP1-like [Sitophilus oryzae]
MLTENSLVLQGVVDHLYRFWDISINFPGSCHDAVVFKNSNLFKRAHDLIPKGTSHIDGKDVPFFLLGDPAYPLLNWLQKPYIGVIDPQEESFNCYLSSARIIVENAFGRLKARWRCLLKRVDIQYSFVPKVVSACCVLHNIVETNKEKFLEQWLKAVVEANIVIPQPTSYVNKESCSDAKSIRDHLKQYMAKNFP